jgi:hypothetical protein
MNGLTKGKILAYLAATFAVGLLAGGFAGGVSSARLRHPERGKPPTPDQIATWITDKLKAELDLTPAQVNQVRPLALTLAVEMEREHLETVQRIQTHVRQTHERMGGFLTPAQREKLKQIQNARERECRERKDKLPATPPPLSPPPAR